ncbi:hypothetical protein COO60DRAFT_1701478 [Scenedesmus sp. NREL 46B-D3]|nr:hypothetical protein COO60DRAFT_1701478 [Scenedesmus sp. NREL 46B-D3]
MSPLDHLPAKNPGGHTLPGDPSAFFPLTRDNMRTNLPKILHQFFTYDLAHIQDFKALIEHLYTPDARFQYPAAELNGRHAISAFWVHFLVGRAVQFNDVHSLKCDVTWDAEKLQAVVQLEAWQHYAPLAWLDNVLKQPVWKVWSTQVMQFEPYPADGPGALRLAFEEELHDQFVFFGLLPMGLYTVRTDPGTPLDTLLTKVRRLVAWGIVASAGVVEAGLQALGYLKRQG